ncbi:sigma factor, partial [Micromonospora sp. NPDC049799]|uniref:sigma factor n=1 Tax=Micromonospora sp. NPDC049799 TaxID=3154741 RepID=UPI0033F9EFC8
MIPVPRASAAAGPADDAVTAARESASEWALAARDGDPVAQAAFVRLTQAEVWRFAAALVDPDSADDLTQETYLRAFRALPGFEGRSSARTWLLGIARRACADHLRTVVRRRRLDARLAADAWTDRPH